VLSVERGLCSQWREACALSGERLVLSVERSLCAQWREACALSGERLVLVCILVIGLVAIGLMRAIDRDSLDASVAEMFSTVYCEQFRNVGERVYVPIAGFTFHLSLYYNNIIFHRVAPLFSTLSY
jgi:hypothetical protein